MIDTTLPVVHRTACNRDCGDACEMLVTVEQGRVTRLQGDPDHPVTRGFLCHRTSRFLERHYDPNRLTEPLLRKGDELVAVSWDEALDHIASSMLTIREQDGGAAIFNYRCGGSLGLMKGVIDYFFEQFGPVTIKSGDICTGAAEFAQVTDFGDFDSHDLFDLLNSKTIILWSKNPFISQVHLIPVLKDARKQGSQIVCIDPVASKASNFADHFLQVRPGGDGALAMAVARLLFQSDRHDRAARDYCDNFDEFHALAFSKPLEEWAALADVPVAQIELLADLYADRPASIVLGWGLQRHSNGASSIRAIDALAAVSGNMGIPGGGVSSYFKRRGAFDESFIKGGGVAPRTIPEPLLGPGLLDATDPKVRMLWITNSNPVVMLPESDTVARALRETELTVVVDAFLTDSARCADVVLPTTTLLEDDDLVGAYGHHWIANVSPVIAPPDGVKTDYEIIQELAARVGMVDVNDGEFSKPVNWWKQRLLSKVSDKGASLAELEKGAKRNPLAGDTLFDQNRFATANGKANLTAELPQEPALAPKGRPLFLLAMSTEKVQGSQWLSDDESRFAVTIHPDSAGDFQQGEIIRIESELGSIECPVLFDESQRRDVLLMPKGGGYARGFCANRLIKAELTDHGECANYLDTPVSISRACS